jgi:hypothetical protein
MALPGSHTEESKVGSDIKNRFDRAPDCGYPVIIPDQTPDQIVLHPGIMRVPQVYDYTADPDSCWHFEPPVTDEEETKRGRILKASGLAKEEPHYKTVPSAFIIQSIAKRSSLDHAVQDRSETAVLDGLRLSL